MKLINAIVEHIFTNLGFMDGRTHSLIAEPLKTDDHIAVQDEDQETHYPVYACETHITQAKIIMAGVVFTDNSNPTAVPDMAVVVNIEDCPTYGCYLSQGEGLIAFTIKDNTWMEANTFLSATFLAGMENLRDVVHPYTQCKDTKSIHQALIAFLKYVDAKNED